ncbi:hypothetical protein MVEN_00106800 [Mycena venus]|uniref:Uncharacterized protein n=1 Tax=Mycena venus TaxID=2733690 RepID=A0A8H6Z4K6_9AGAR|nr:hypothetical protein MVEN_00106800 [Mycena venus]
MRSSPTRSICPLTRPPHPPCRHPEDGALVSADFYRIVPVGASAELQDIGGQRGEAAVGVLSSQVVRDLLTSRKGRLSRSSFFPRGALPSQHRCVLAPARAIAFSTSSPLPHIATTHANGCLKGRKTTVSRHQILSALFQEHRVPTRRTSAAVRSCLPVRERPLRASPEYELRSIEGEW